MILSPPRRPAPGYAVIALFVFLVGLSAPAPVAAQYSKTTYFETWGDIQTVFDFSDRFRYDGDYGFRAWPSTDDFTQIYLRPSVRYEALPWLRLHGGLGWFHTFFAQTDDVDELRPWVGLRLVGPRPGGFLIQNYFRLEYRAFSFGLAGDADRAWRIRWQLHVRSPDFRIGSAERFYAVAFSEFFQTLGAEIQGFAGERIRLNLGLGKTLNPHWRLELNGMFQHGRVEEGAGGFDLDEGILRLRAVYTIN